MKVKVSEQDLTDYALNELGPEERIYVETVLAGSEESREDVYAMIDIAMMLDAGFEREQILEPAVLTAAQRRALLSVRGPNIFLRNSVAALAAAACVTLAFAHLDSWLPRFHLPQAKMAATTPGRTGPQASATAEQPDFVQQIMQFRELANDQALRKLFNSLTLPSSASPAPAMNMEAVLESMPLEFMP